MLLLWEDGYKKEYLFGTALVGQTHAGLRPIEVIVEEKEMIGFDNKYISKYLSMLSKVTQSKEGTVRVKPCPS